MLSKILKIIVIIIALAAIATAVKFFIFKKDYNIFIVEKGDIVNSVSASGFVVSDLISDLYFNASGKIKEINFQTGDKIKMGSILAQLEAKQEKRHLSEIKLLLEKANNNLTAINSLTIEEVKEFEVELTKLEIELKEVQLNNLKGLSTKNKKIAESKIQNLQNILADSDMDLLKAEEKIKEVADTGEEEITKNRQLLIETIEEILSISSSTLAKTDNILGVDNKEVNDQFEEYLGVLKSGTFKSAKLAYKQSKNDYFEISNNFSLLNKIDGNEGLDVEKINEIKEKESGILQIVGLTEKLLLSMDNLLFKTRILLNNTETYEIAPNKKRPKDDTKKIFTKNELADFKSMVDNKKSQNSSKIDLLKNQKESLILTEKNLLIAEGKFQNEYDKINSSNQEIVENLKEIQENFIKTKEDDEVLIKTTELNLNKKRRDLVVIKGSSKTKINTGDLEKLLNKAKELLFLAQKNLDDTKLKAPNNCIITDVKAKIGDDIYPSQIFAIAISTQVVAEANIIDSDINKIKIGQKTIFNFADNLKSEGKKYGEIVAVDFDNKKIKAALNEYSSNIIQFRMPIDLTIIITEKENTLFVPLNAVIKKSNGATVKILQNKKIQDREIKIGIIGNNNMVEIVSGLERGEEIIIL